MNLGDLFKFSPSTPAQQAAPQQPQQQPTSLQTPNTAQNMNTAAVLQQGPQGQQPVENKPSDPLAEFSKLWEKKPDTPTDQFQLLNADASKIQEMASKINFTQGLKPESVKAALAGDANALLQVINHAVQQGFATATQASSALADRQAASAVDFMKQQLPSQFKQLSVSNELRAENPQFSNPAVAPLLSLIQERLSQQYPDASPAELKQYAKKYLGGVVEAVAPGTSAIQNQAEKEPDENAAFLRQMQATQTSVNNFDWDTWATGQVKTPS